MLIFRHAPFQLCRCILPFGNLYGIDFRPFQYLRCNGLPLLQLLQFFLLLFQPETVLIVSPALLHLLHQLVYALLESLLFFLQ